MDFHPQEPFDRNRPRRHVWASLKEAFKGDPGVAYYRYPIFARGGRRHREPDILLVHPRLGLWVIECKGCETRNVAAVLGHEWRMRDWYEETATPPAQAEDQMFAVKNRYAERRETRDLLRFHFRVALPYVRRDEWRQRGFDGLTGEAVLLREDLGPKALREALERGAASCPQKPLTPEEWGWATAVLRGELPGPPRPVATGTPEDSPVRVIRAVEARFKALDEEQQKAAYEIPDGPQRLRGLAGTGKTVLLARRLAKIHARHPDWRVAFVFFTRSLDEQVRGLFGDYFRGMTGESPDFDKAEVLHAWGGQQLPGFYHNLAVACGRTPHTKDSARRKRTSTRSVRRPPST
jgi:hypothetical protein